MAEPPRQGGMLAAAADGLRRLRRKKRAHERLAREGQVYVFSAIAYLGLADLLDESDVGARLAAPSEAMLREAAYLLKPRYATCADLVLAWAGGGEAGYRFSRVRSLRGFNPEPDIDHVRAFWTSVEMDHSLIAPGGAFSGPTR